jgi:hypothetical protein
MKWKDGNSIYELVLRFGYSGCEVFIYIHYRLCKVRSSLSDCNLQVPFSFIAG